MGNDNYSLSFGNLIERSGFKGSVTTVHKYRQIGLIDCKKGGRRHLYSPVSVEQLKLIPELKKYALYEAEIKETLTKVPLDVLTGKVGKVTVDDLYEILFEYKVKLDSKRPYSPKLPPRAKAGQ